MAASASAFPVATNDAEYNAFGDRVFPDPMAGCTTPPCDPNAQGQVPATQFIGVDEIVDALRYMNGKPEWQRYMEVWALDGKLDHQTDGPGVDGNNLPLEFDPKPEYVSAGLPTTDLERRKSDLMVVRVTDESVPDRGKKRYALSLSIHGIERAGAEGGTRAIEDLVTAATTGRSNMPIVPPEVKRGAPTVAEVLRRSIIYFTYPNPDGWRRGSVSSGPEGNVFFQRYNGNGVDPNRDWPDVGFSFRPYSAVSEPETRAWINFYNDVKRKTDSRFAAGDDLHGQPEADALSYTLLPHGSHDYAKDLRIRESAKRINRGTYEAIKWSPIVQDNDQPKGGGPPCAPGPLGEACAKIYGQTWGSVYDTINYTTTGALGDWFDSRIGLNADGIDNEMSFSHLDKNIVFDPHTEQLHVAGNKALIYARLAEIIDPPENNFDAPGRKGYVANTRVQRAERPFQPGPPPGTRAQDDHTEQGIPLQSEFEIPVQRSAEIYNGGMRVDVTNTNVGGIGSGTVGLEVQCQHCDDHPGVKDDEDWVTVAEDYNQSSLYFQAGVTAAVNRPQTAGTDGKKVNWRAIVTGAQRGTPKVFVDFTHGPATDDGASGGDEPPVERGYDVANTDFMADLNRHVAFAGERFRQVDPRAVIEGRASLSRLDSLVLADNPLPGYTGGYGAATLGPAPPDFAIESTTPTVAGGYSPNITGVEERAPGSYETREFTVTPEQSAGGVRVRIDWTDLDDDYDMYLYRRTAEGRLVKVGESTGTGGTTTSEEIDIRTRLKTGTYVLYVDNWAAKPLQWKGSVSFRPVERASDTGAYSRAEMERWAGKLRDFVEGGGNLVLTDGALEILPEITPRIPLSAVGPTTVYVGQMAFGKGPDENTTDDPLATRPLTLSQPGARFNTGMRRQMYEPTPLGFAIQNSEGADSSFARQYDIDRSQFEEAGGRVAATSADGGARNAQAVYDRVTLGELKLGSGQIRVAGALLPQPTEEYDHPQGIESHAVTYSGYILFRNLLEVQPRGVVAAGNNRFKILTKRVRVRVNRKGKHIARIKVRCKARRGCFGKLNLKVRKTKRPGKRDQAESAGRKRKRVQRVTIGRKKRFGIRRAAKAKKRVLRVKLTLEGRRLSSRKERLRTRGSATVRFGKKGNGGSGVARRRIVLRRAKGLRPLPPDIRRRRAARARQP